VLLLLLGDGDAQGRADRGAHHRRGVLLLLLDLLLVVVVLQLGLR
jgi:hypothetical protein